MSEGDNVTPEGCFEILDVFHRPDRRRDVAASRSVAIDARWSDDPSDPSYNRLRPHDWRFSSEQMRRADGLYDIVATLDFNTNPTAPGRGSAIFLHVWRAARFPMAGCVAFRQADLEWILSRWNQRSRVVIRG